MMKPGSVFAYNSAGVFDTPDYVLLTEDFQSRNWMQAGTVATYLNEALAVVAGVTALRDSVRTTRQSGADTALLRELDAILAKIDAMHATGAI